MKELLTLVLPIVAIIMVISLVIYSELTVVPLLEKANVTPECNCEFEIQPTVCPGMDKG
jgi:hypothetical protein